MKQTAKRGSDAQNTNKGAGSGTQNKRHDETFSNDMRINHMLSIDDSQYQ